MLRILILLILTPTAVLAQGAAPQAPAAPQTPAAPRAAAPSTAAPRTAAPSPATRKPPSPARTPAATAAPVTDEQRTVYALGLLMQRSLGQFDLSAAELDLVKRALTDAAAGKPAIDVSEWGPKVQPFASTRGARIAAREKVASTAYLTKAAAEAGAVRTESGLVYRELSAGTGASPTATDTVRVHYRGTLINGTVFDSSYERNEPAQFPLGGVIRCWTEGLQKMKVGGKARLVCPSDIAYGDEGRPSIPGGAALVFEVELLEIAVAAAQPPAN
jgi:FKBP-type peptidyl-prolyl cis-trans isomerase FkpA